MRTVVDVGEVINRQRIGRFQFRIVFLCALVQFLDGFDNQAIAFVAPSLTQTWHLARADLGPVFGAGAFGTLIGSLLMGPLGDRFGRKTLMLASLLLVAVFSLLTAFADTLTELLVLRLITGIGLGAMIPSTIVMPSEFAPLRTRATMVTLMACGFALGAALGGMVASVLLPHFGWTAIFYLGAAAPLLLALVLIPALPESVRFLVLKRADRAKIAAILHKIEPGLAIAPDAEFSIATTPQKSWVVAELFREGRTRITVLLWIAFFMNSFALNFLNNWLPTVLHGTGIAIETAVRIAALFQIGGIVGVISMGALSDRFGYYRVIITAYMLAAVFIALIGLMNSSITVLPVVICLCGFCVIGVQMTVSALSATLYPTAIRSTGSSWGLGIGRFGSFAGPVLGGIFLSLDWPLSLVFPVAAIPALLGTCVVFLMARSRGREPQGAVMQEART